MDTRIEEAAKKTEEIETSVKCVHDAENLPREVDDLVQRKEIDMKAMGKFEGNTHQQYSRVDSLPCIQYLAASKDFIYFGSRQKAYDELFEALNDDSVHIIGLYGVGGSGKTTLAIEVGKQAEDRKMFDKVISITVSQTPDIRGIQEELADMLKLKFDDYSASARAQRLWLHLQEKKRILIIVDDLWTDFDLKMIGIRLDDVNKHTCKILITTPHKLVCTSLECQKRIHLELLSEDESWHLFQKFAKIDDKHSELLDDVPQKICKECMGLPIAIKIVGKLFNEREDIEWQQAYEKLRDSKASDVEDKVTLCIQLSYDHLPTQRAKQIFLLCALFPEEYHIQIEDLVRYVVGLGRRAISSLESMRNSTSAVIKEILSRRLVAPGSVKMHNMVRDAALWIANRSDDCKILVNVDKPLSTVAEDNRIRDCFALSSWWFNENPSFCQLHAPNLKMLLVNISAPNSLNSLDLSPLTFEGIEGLQVFSLTINYKIVPISFPPTVQKLTNVRTLRLNGLKLGDISFIVSLTALEVLDLRRCYFNELPIELRKLESLKLLDLSECHISESYNDAIGRCSKLEELYALPCYPEFYVQKMILDTDRTLPKLQRFVQKHSYFPKKKIFTDLKNLNIFMFKGSKMNILQMAETISLTGLHGGCKNIIPDMVGVVGGMNNLSTLHLNDCREIECIFDTTCDFKEDDMIPRLVELCLNSVYNLTELCRGPPLQVLHYFEKLEVLDIKDCRQLHCVFPRQCNLRNLKILRLSYCRTDELLFSESVAQSLQQLEQLTIHGCNELKHLIAASGREHGGCSSEEIIPAAMNLMTNLRDINIYNCQSLESIFPLCYVEGLPRLRKIDMSNSPKLEHVFGKCDHDLSSHQNLNHVMLPHLEVLKLGYCLNNFIGMCPVNYQANWLSQSLRILSIQTSPKVAIPWFNLNVGYDQRQHPLNEIWSFQCLERLTVAHCEELKCLFSIDSHRSLPELMYLSVSDCQELEQIVAENEELVELPNAELYFPKLKDISVSNCNKLKSLFPLSMVTVLPQLSTLVVSNCEELEQIVAANEELVELPNAELYFPKLKDILVSNCNKLKSLFPLSMVTMLPQLSSLSVSHCEELEQIVAANEELVELPNAELYFQKLKDISVYNCNKLKSLFPLSIVTMLPQLSTLHLRNSTQLQVVFRHSQGDGIMNEIEIILPNLTDLSLANLPTFVDICHGCNLYAVKLQRLSIINCPKTASSLRIIEDQIEEASEDSRYPYPTSSISNDEKDFIYFDSTKVAYNQILEALKDDFISIIGVYGKGGCGKTTLVTEVGKKVKELDMFEKVISITMSRTPDIRGIQRKIADMLNLKLGKESKEERAQHLWMCLKEQKRILIIVDDLWSKSHLMDIGIRLDDVVSKKTLKILITTRHGRVCRSIDFQKKIHLELLSEDESWHLFQKFAGIDDEDSKILNNVPRIICKECMGLPIAIKIVGSLFKGRNDIEWEQAFQKLRYSKEYEGLENVKLSDDDLTGQEAQQIFGLCSLFLEDNRTPTDDLVRYAHGLSNKERSSLRLMSSIIARRQIDELLHSCL